VAESEQTPLIDMAAQDESVGRGQPAAQDSEPVTAVAVKDSPAAETPAESDGVLREPENSVTETVMDTREQDPEPVGTGLVADPVGAVEEPSAAKSEAALEPAMTVSGIEESVSVVLEPQDSASPTDTSVQKTAETVLVSEAGTTDSAGPIVVAEGRQPETAADETPTATESEPSVSQQTEETIITEVEQTESSPESMLGTPPTPVEENGEKEAKEKRQAIKPLSVSPIAIRPAFLPVQSAQNRSGYTLRGLF
jgi:hypothetical protein